MVHPAALFGLPAWGPFFAALCSDRRIWRGFRALSALRFRARSSRFWDPAGVGGLGGGFAGLYE
jgi:hypothetical protein